MSVLRFRLDPIKEREHNLFHTFCLCRKLHNRALEERVVYYRDR